MSKRYKALLEKVDNTKEYSLAEAVALVKDLKSAKFDESIDLALNLNVDPRHADQMIRGAVVLPNGTGKSVRVAVYAKGTKVDEAKAAGADIVGTDEFDKFMERHGFRSTAYRNKDYNKIKKANNVKPKTVI